MGRRIKSKCFWILLAVVLVDLFIPFAPVAALALLFALFRPEWLKGMAAFLLRAHEEIA